MFEIQTSFQKRHIFFDLDTLNKYKNFPSVAEKLSEKRKIFTDF